MSFLDDILEKYNVKYEDLKPPEKETLNVWMNALQQNQLNIEKIREYISQMKFAVENELAKHETNDKQDLYLKARLRNYMLLEAFLSTPEKAKAQMENALAGMVGKKI